MIQSFAWRYGFTKKKRDLKRKRKKKTKKISRDKTLSNNNRVEYE